MPKIRYESDKQRDLQTYEYLLQICGFVCDFEKRTFPKELEDKKLFNMWIQEKKDSTEKDRERKFISRLLESFKEDNDLPELSLYRLVEILTSIDEYFDRQKEFDGNKQPKILTNQEKLRAIRKYCELTRKEKSQLNLPIDFQSFIQENIKTCIGDERESKLSQDQAVNLFNLLSTNNDNDHETIEVNKNVLKLLVTSIIKDETNKKWVADNEEYLEFIIKKIKNQIDSIKVQSGLQNISAINEGLEGCQKQFEKTLKQHLETILADKSIKQLTRNILTNIRLTAKFPIELRNIEVNNIEYLPLENSDDNDLINENLLEHDDNPKDIRAVISSFKSRKTYSVKIRFRLRVKEDPEDKNIDFFEEVIGTSSILSLVRKALNRALLWDIPCLREYFPVAQEVNLEDNVFSGDTLAIVWSKSRLRLVKLQDLKELINEDELRQILDSQENSDKTKSCPLEDEDFDFDSYVEGTDICQGDFSGFDLIESIAKSGFFARLKILNELNINSEEYIKDLKNRIQEKKALRKGKQYLHSYPFSLLAMEHHFEENILQKYYSNNVLTLKKERLSNIAYQAILTIIQGYLTEGLYKKAETKLQTLDSHLQYFTHFLRADYYLCKAECTLLSQEQNKSQNSIIKECTDYLRRSKNELLLRVLEFFRIGEISQGNLSPLFTHWARIYAFEARLSLFFPRLFKESSSISELFQPLTLFGNARINAARDGDSFLSFQMALYQSWCYLMQAYIGDGREGFGKEDCLKWAKKLLDFALIGYKKDSHEKYQDYMQAVFAEYDDNDDVNYEKYGDNLKIQRLPFIRLFNDYKPSQEQTGLDYKINSSLIKRKLLNSNGIPSETIDLFGQYSGLYFYSYGMFKLCDDYSGQNIEEIREGFQDAFDYFFCALSISSGGATVEEKTRLDRNFNYIELKSHDGKELRTPSDKFNVSALKGLYFHRIMELVDLSKIFAALIKSIIAQSEEELKEGRSFLWENDKSIGILTNVPDKFEEVGISNGQKHYNIHLQGQFERIKSYLIEYCLSQVPELNSSDEILACRDQRVSRVFRYLRGD